MVQRVRRSHVIHTDDTPVPVLDPTLGHTRTGRFWVYCGDRDNPYSVYDYTASRKRDGPAKFLAESICSYLQTDAFAGYDGIYAAGTVKQVPLLPAHARRKDSSRPKGDQAARGRTEALAWIARLYADRAARRKTRRTTERWTLRQGADAAAAGPVPRVVSVVDRSRLAQESVGTSRAVRAAALGRLCTFL